MFDVENIPDLEDLIPGDFGDIKIKPREEEESEGEGRPPKDFEEKIKWFWDKYVKDPKSGMSFEEYIRASIVEASHVEISNIKLKWDNFDTDRSGTLSYEELARS
jgi:hypothetical protein